MVVLGANNCGLGREYWTIVEANHRPRGYFVTGRAAACNGLGKEGKEEYGFLPDGGYGKLPPNGSLFEPAAPLTEEQDPLNGKKCRRCSNESEDEDEDEDKDQAPPFRMHT